MIMFQKGDKVRVIGGKGYESWVTHEEALGQIGTVDYSIKDPGESVLLSDNKWGINFEPEWLELVEEDTDFYGDGIASMAKSATEAMMLRYADIANLDDKAATLYESLKKRLRGGENKMSKTFKVGDYIWPIDIEKELSCGTLRQDIRAGIVKKVRVTEVDTMMRWEAFEKDGKRLYGTCCKLNFDEVKKVSSTGLMSNLAILAKKLLDADTKVFVKAGFLDESLQLTDEGKEFLLTQYFADNKAALAKEAKAMLDEQAKEEKD